MPTSEVTAKAKRKRSPKKKTGATAAKSGTAAVKAAAHWVHISKLVPWVKNPRTNDGDVKDMAQSMVRWGFEAPIIAWPDAAAYTYSDGVKQDAGHRIAAGHLRRKGALYLFKDEGFSFEGAPGPGMVPVRFTPFVSEPEFEAYALRDNNPLGTYDEDMLAFVLKDIQEAGASITGIGFTDKFLEQVMAGSEPLPPFDASEEPPQMTYKVLVQCRDELHQGEVLERLEAEGLSCRVVVS